MVHRLNYLTQKDFERIKERVTDRNLCDYPILNEKLPVGLVDWIRQKYYEKARRMKK